MAHSNISFGRAAKATNRILTTDEQQRIVELVHAAGFEKAIQTGSLEALLWCAAGAEPHRQQAALEIVEAFLEHGERRASVGGRRNIMLARPVVPDEDPG